MKTSIKLIAYFVYNYKTYVPPFHYTYLCLLNSKSVVVDAAVDAAGSAVDAVAVAPFDLLIKTIPRDPPPVLVPVPGAL
jgi:hypothetical protein